MEFKKQSFKTKLVSIFHGKYYFNTLLKTIFVYFYYFVGFIAKETFILISFSLNSF